MVARNLVAGALGIRTNVSREQRQKEKQMLSEAIGLFIWIIVREIGVIKFYRVLIQYSQ